MRHLTFVDGSSLGNPGSGGIGIAIYKFTDPNVPIRSISESIGLSTNNEAEYYALIRGLQTAIEMKLDEVSIFSDSKLVVEQVNGNWKVREPRLIILYQGAKRLMELLFESISSCTLAYIPRRKNAAADILAQNAARKYK